MLQLGQLCKNLLADADQFIQPGAQILQIGSINLTVFIGYFGVLVQIVATHLQKVGENMGIRKHKQIIEEIQETVSHWHETAKDCGVKPEHADFIGENLLLFGKQLHTIHMPDIANEQEQAFMKAMRNDDFNTILKLKMRGYQPSENTLKSLQPDVSATTFIAAAKIFQMEGMLKSLQDIKPAQSPITGGNKRSMELGD